MFIARSDEHVWDATKNVYHGIAVGCWTKGRSHWGGRGTSEHTCVGRLTDTERVWCAEEVAYEQRLAAVFETMDTGQVQVNAVVQFEDVNFDRLYNALWFVTNHEYWARDLDFEVRARRSPNAPVFCSWHNVEVFWLPRGLRPDFYVFVPTWWEAKKPSRVLLVPTATGFAYYSGLILGKYLVGNSAWRIATSDLRVTSLVAILVTARDDVLLT